MKLVAKPPMVQCKSQAPPDLLEEDGLARPVVDVEELEMHIGELRSALFFTCTYDLA